MGLDMRAARPHSAPRRRPTNSSGNVATTTKGFAEVVTPRGRSRPVSAPRQRQEVASNALPEWHRKIEDVAAEEPWETSMGSLASWRHSVTELPDDFMAVEDWHLAEHEP